MPAFCLTISSLLFIALANLIYRLFYYLSSKKINVLVIKSIQFVVLIAISVSFIDVEKIQYNHTEWIKNLYKDWQVENVMIANQAAGKYDSEKTIVFNCRWNENIPFMFFSNYTAYCTTPTIEEYTPLKREGYKILYINNDKPIPNYLKTDSDVVFLNNYKEEKSITLKTNNNKYLCNDERLNQLIANRNEAKQWETFSILLFFKNNKCALRTSNNNFLSADLHKSCEIAANRTSIGDWEIFTITYLTDEHIALKAVNGKYLSLDKNSNHIFATANTIGENEKFKIIEKTTQ